MTETSTMDDASLAVFLNISEAEAAVIIPGLTPAKRALYERMASVCADLNMGIVPEGVMVCRPKCGGH
jgi:hypothetical protein